MTSPLDSVVAALSRPSTLKALSRKTEFSTGNVLKFITQARAAGHIIRAVPREGQSTYYERIDHRE